MQLGDADTLPPDTKPKMSSLFQTMTLSTLTLDDALQLLHAAAGRRRSTPRAARSWPPTVATGRSCSWGEETRSLDAEEKLLTVTVDEAVAVLAQPKQFGRRRAAPVPPLRELGPDPVSGQHVVVKDGRFGPYVTDGETNASLRKGDTVEGVTIERAAELLQIRREAGPDEEARRQEGAGQEEGGREEGRGQEGRRPKKTAAKKTAQEGGGSTKAAAEHGPGRGHDRGGRGDRAGRGVTTEPSSPAVGPTSRPSRSAGRAGPDQPGFHVRMFGSHEFFRLWLTQVVSATGDWLGLPRHRRAGHPHRRRLRRRPRSAW